MWNNRPTKVQAAAICVTALIALLAFGLVASRSLRRSEEWARRDFLRQAEVLARAVPLASIRSLTGTEADASSPVYNRLKQQLSAAKAMDGRWEWVYLMGRRKNGEVFFFVDSESDDSEMPSPPGQTYTEATPLLRSLFDTRRECVEGPETDRWGTWVSPLVPISDPQTGAVVAVLGIDIDARLWHEPVALATHRLVVLGAALVSLFLAWLSLHFFWRGTWRRRMYVNVTGVVATGSMLAASLLYLGLEDAKRHRAQSFGDLARLHADHVLDEFHDIEAKDLPSFASFFRGSEEVSDEEFDLYAESLWRSPVICSWAWAPCIPFPDQASPPPGGEHRETGYRHPVTRFWSPSGAPPPPGHDPASDPGILATLQSATETGMATATDPVELSCLNPPAVGILVVLPTDRQGSHARATCGGHIIAAVGSAAVGRLLHSDALVLQDGTQVTVELVCWDPDGKPGKTIAATAEHPTRNGAGTVLTHTQPIFAFGRAYALRTHIPVRGAGLSGARAAAVLPLAGLLATLTVAALVALLEHGWQKLRRTADLRTVELRKSIDRNNELARHSRTLSWEVDADGVYTYLSDSTQQILGYQPEEIVGRLHYYDLHPEQGREELIRAGREVFQAKGDFENYENAIETRDGRVLWVSTNGVPVLGESGELLGYRGTDRDITEERSARLGQEFHTSLRGMVAEVAASLVVLRDEELDTALVRALRRVGEQFEAKRCLLFRIATDGGTISSTHEWCADTVPPIRHDLQGIDAGPQWWWLSKLRAGEHLQLANSQDLPPEAGEAKAFMDRHAVSSLLVLPMRNSAGEFVGFSTIEWAESMPPPEVEETSLLGVLTGIVASVLERRQEAQARAASEERYRLLTEGMRDAVWLVDVQTMRCIYASSAAETLLGYTQEEAIGLGVADVLANERGIDWRELIGGRAAALAAGEIPFGRYYTREMQMTRKDGSLVWTELVSCYRLNPENGHIEMQGVARDISERKQAEQERADLQKQLVQAQKMESVGRLAGGIAHDFNNMLQAILGYTEMAMEQTDPGGQLYHDIEEIQKTVDRSANLTRQLLAFARRQTVLPKVIDLNGVVADMLGMLRRLIGEEIHLAWAPGQALWRTNLDPNQVGMVLTNLCVNARDAMEGGGRIMIESRNVEVDDVYCANHADARPGEYVALVVSDCGCGMDRTTLDRIFDPFFTTKDVDKGTGLGLATVYGIARQNEGFVNVYSELGQGTTFSVYFPRHHGESVPNADRLSEHSGQGGSETILVVEDEPALLSMCGETLGRLGYRVLLASLPEQALELAKEHAAEIRLLMTDVVMPEMNGRQLAEKIALEIPGIRCLYMSGYPESAISHHGVLDEGLEFISKPFSRRALATKVREILDTPGDGEAQGDTRRPDHQAKGAAE